MVSTYYYNEEIVGVFISVAVKNTPNKTNLRERVYLVHNSRLLSVLDRVSIAVKRHHDRGNSYKGKHLLEVATWFRGSVHYRHGGK